MSALENKNTRSRYLDLALFIETGQALAYYYKNRRYLLDFYALVTNTNNICYGSFEHWHGDCDKEIHRIVSEIDKSPKGRAPVQAFSKLFYYAAKAGILRALSQIKECMHHNDIVDDLDDWEAGFDRDNSYLRERGSYMVSRPEFTYEDCCDDLKIYFALQSDNVPDIFNAIRDITDVDYWFDICTKASECDDSDENIEYYRLRDISCHEKNSNIWLVVNFLVAAYFEKNMDFERDFAKQLRAYRKFKKLSL